jgi:rfaE bifunctional protein kinase chain/domain
MKNLNVNKAETILNNAIGKQIAVIGDVMLDRYFWGNVSRISPEAPVPVIDVESETFHLGGAANVAKNLKSLNIEPVLYGVLGDDNSGRSFVTIAKEFNINTEGLYLDRERPTTVKTRIIGNNQQIARIDREVRTALSDKGLNYILNNIKGLNNLSGVILEDYNKGCLTKELIKEVITFCKGNNIPVFVDPKSSNFFDYKHVTLLKPNKKEAQNALGLALKDNEEIIIAGKQLLERLQCQNVLITLGSLGMMLFESNGEISSVPTLARHVSDVSGAGDTAIAVLAAAYSGGANVKEASSMANYAAGLVCEKPGIVSVEINELLESIKRNF